MEQIASQKILLPIIPWFLEKYKPWTAVWTGLLGLFMYSSQLKFECDTDWACFLIFLPLVLLENSLDIIYFKFGCCHCSLMFIITLILLMFLIKLLFSVKWQWPVDLYYVHVYVLVYLYKIILCAYVFLDVYKILFTKVRWPTQNSKSIFCIFPFLYKRISEVLRLLPNCLVPTKEKTVIKSFCKLWLEDSRWLNLVGLAVVSYTHVPSFLYAFTNKL